MPFDTEGRRLLLKLLDKYTETAVAKAVGCAQQQVSSWKHGKSRPADRCRARLDSIFGLKAESWLTGRERAEIRRSTPPPKPRAA